MTARAFLALACAFLLALPPDWCCHATRAVGCDPRPWSVSPAPARPKCADCCCSKTVPAPEDAPPAPARKPACCERPAGIVERSDLPSDAAPPVATFISPVPTPAPPVRGDLPTAPASPPVRLLHCVWRC